MLILRALSRDHNEPLDRWRVLDSNLDVGGDDLGIGRDVDVFVADRGNGDDYRGGSAEV